MNFGQLKEAVRSWADRTDLDALMTTFVELAEQRIYNGVQVGQRRVAGLRLQGMLTTVSPFTVGTLPADLLKIERVAAIYSNYKKPLVYASSESLADDELLTSTAQGYTVRGNELIVGPAFGEDVELIYYARPVTPTGDSDTNVVLQKAPSVYLYGALREVGAWLRDPELVSMAEPQFMDAMDAAQAADDEARRGVPPLRIVTDQRVRA